MARLTIRQLSPRDVPGLRHVRDHRANVAPWGPEVRGITMLDRATSVIRAEVGRRVRTYVALIDDEVCAYVAMRPEPERFSWNVVEVAAGSPHLDADESEAIELWSALLEYGTRCAGEFGTKRMFADLEEGSPAHASFSRAGFDGYARRELWTSRWKGLGLDRLEGFRPQTASDVWSIHHLYHRVTPKAIQFAEALTSSTWESRKRGSRGRNPVARRKTSAFVHESTMGLDGYCRVDLRRGAAWIELIVDTNSDLNVTTFVSGALIDGKAPFDECVSIVVPGYAVELGSALEPLGFLPAGERIAMVRHTTAPAAVHTRLAPIPVVEAERSARAAPTFNMAEDPGQDRVHASALSRSGSRLPSPRLGKPRLDDARLATFRSEQ